MQTLRLVKSKVELDIMAKAAETSAEAHRQVSYMSGTALATETSFMCAGLIKSQIMAMPKVGMPEATLVAEFAYSCAVKGASRLGYEPVVASG